jgi:phosphoribosyl 1,2-cyclic phosphodiesterase
MREGSGNRNVRNNICGLLSVPHADGRVRHVLLDCGKTFRAAALGALAALGVERLDAVVLTHSHADAMGGLDDLRDVSPRTPLSVYCSETTYRRAAAAFDYLVAAAAPAALFTAMLDWRIVRAFEPFAIADTGIIAVPLPLEHCEPGPMLGFEFRYTAADGLTPPPPPPPLLPPLLPQP